MNVIGKTDMLRLLETLVNIDSGSYHKTGVDAVGEELIGAYEPLGFKAAVFKQPIYGNHILVQHTEAKQPAILLLAHMDTVYPVGTVKKRPFSIKGEQAYGPGVIDMKGSHVTAFAAIKALSSANPQAAKNVALLLTSDEEIGAPTGRPLIEEHGKGKRAVLVMEPARKDGSLVTARRGGGRFTLDVSGKAAHAGVEPEKGRSAIAELAAKITKLHALSDHDAGISINAGLIEGGTSVNTVASHAKAQIDVRISKLNQAEPLEQRIHAICQQPWLDGTAITVTGGVTRPPMERNDDTMELVSLIKAIGTSMGLHLTETATGGSSDASFTSALGIPTIDGMGPVGGNQHSEEEYLEIESLEERALLLAYTIEALSAKTK